MSLSAHDQHRPLVAILRPCGKALCDDMLRGAVDRCAALADLGFKLLRRLLERKPGQPGADPVSRLDQRGGRNPRRQVHHRSEEHTSELQSLMRISYAVFCLKK